MDMHLSCLPSMARDCSQLSPPLESHQIVQAGASCHHWKTLSGKDGAIAFTFERQLDAHLSHTHHLRISGPFPSFKQLVPCAPTLEFLSLSQKFHSFDHAVIPINLFNCTAPSLTSLKLQYSVIPNIYWRRGTQRAHQIGCTLCACFASILEIGAHQPCWHITHAMHRWAAGLFLYQTFNAIDGYSVLLSAMVCVQGWWTGGGREVTTMVPCLHNGRAYWQQVPVQPSHLQWP